MPLSRNLVLAVLVLVVRIQSVCCISINQGEQNFKSIIASSPSIGDNAALGAGDQGVKDANIHYENSRARRELLESSIRQKKSDVATDSTEQGSISVLRSQDRIILQLPSGKSMEIGSEHDNRTNSSISIQYHDVMWRCEALKIRDVDAIFGIYNLNSHNYLALVTRSEVAMVLNGHMVL